MEKPAKANCWTLKSKTHHEVYTDGDRWLKVARDSSAMAEGEIRTDASVLAALGREVGLNRRHDGRLAHLTSHMGDPCPDIEYDPLPILAQLRDAWSRVTPETGPPLKDVNDWIGRTQQKIEIRVQDAEVRQMLLDRLPDRISTSEESWGLCHTDPHVGNVLTGPDGFVVLDWESALYGPAELDAAAVALSLWNLGRHADAVEVISNREEAAPLITTKATSGASWAWANVGPELMQQRLQACDDLLARI